MRVLVSGASVAGPAVAHWLGRYGYDVTVVEIAPGLRDGGYAVDFRGPVNREVLSRMGCARRPDRPADGRQSDAVRGRGRPAVDAAAR